MQRGSRGRGSEPVELGRVLARGCCSAHRPRGSTSCRPWNRAVTRLPYLCRLWGTGSASPFAPPSPPTFPGTAGTGGGPVLPVPLGGMAQAGGSSNIGRSRARPDHWAGIWPRRPRSASNLGGGGVRSFGPLYLLSPLCVRGEGIGDRGPRNAANRSQKKCSYPVQGLRASSRGCWLCRRQKAPTSGDRR